MSLFPPTPLREEGEVYKGGPAITNECLNCAHKSHFSGTYESALAAAPHPGAALFE